MTWTISHGKTNPGGAFDGYHSRSYSQVGEWRDALDSMLLSPRDRGILAPLLTKRSGDPFEIPARQAGVIAGILRGVQRRMPRGQREMNEAMADAADRAFAAGQPWRWS